MTLDVVCGELGFVDLTFVGLDALPGPGEERHARALMRSPGGGAITAVGCARLGLSAALASPIGADEPGDFLRSALTSEGVACSGRTIAQTAITVVMPVAGERAMATVAPDEQATAAELAAGDPRAVVLSLPRIGLAPPAARLYATVGDLDARTGRLPDELEDARALIVNAREAELLTGHSDPAVASRDLASRGTEAIVTLGPDGALGCAEGELVSVPGIPADAVDTTGAGDLFTAAYVWADLAGAPLEDRLRWAVLSSGMGVGVPTAVGGAPTLQELAQAGAGIGLVLPVSFESTVPRRDSL